MALSLVTPSPQGIEVTIRELRRHVARLRRVGSQLGLGSLVGEPHQYTRCSGLGRRAPPGTRILFVKVQPQQFGAGEAPQ